MIISKQELLDVLDNAYHTAEQVKLLNKQISDSLADYAKDNELSKKAMRRAYTTYTAYKNGSGGEEDEDYFDILNVIEDHFSGVDKDTADKVAL